MVRCSDSGARRRTATASGSKRAGRGGRSRPGQLVSAGDREMRAIGAALTAILYAAGLAAGGACGCAGGADRHQLHHPVPGRRRLQAAGLRRPLRRRAARAASPSPSPATRACRCRASIAPLAGLARPEFDDEMKAEEASRETFHIGVVMIGFWDRIHMRISAAGPRRPGLERMARGIRQARRPLDQDAEAQGRRALLGGPADHAPHRGERARAGDERHRPREGLSQRHQVHRHPGPFCRRGRQLRALRTRHHGQAAAAARGRRRAVHGRRQSQARAVRRAGDQARPQPGQERAGDPAGRQRGRAEARRRAAASHRRPTAAAAGRAR